MGVNQTWNASYENSPAAGDNPGGGDNAIRNLKTSISTRLAKEHRFPTDENLGRQGIHRAGSAFPFISESEPQLRTDGTDFENGIDEGRLWINSSNGRMYYLKSVDEEDGSPTWSILKLETIGKYAAFPSQPDASERWTLCDGRLISKADTSLDGEEGGYSDLIDFLNTEAAGNSDHPFYASADGNSAYLPDLRGVGLRGLDSFNQAGSDQGSSDRDEAGSRINARTDASVDIDTSGSYQDDYLLDHRHEMDHTHGSTVTEGHDSGNGRTGVPDWLGGDPQPGEESENWKGDNYLSTNGILTMRHPNSTDNQGAFAQNCANDINVTVDLEHHHTIPRHYGITRKLSEAAEDTLHGVPEDDVDYSDESTMKNVGVYWFIKY